MTIRQTAALFRPIRTVRVPLPERANGVSKLRKVVEGRTDWDDPAMHAKAAAWKSAQAAHQAVEGHLDAVHGHIATLTNDFASNVRDNLHGEKADEGKVTAAHDAHMAKYNFPESARPAAREHMASLIKHAKFMHGVVAGAATAAKAADDDFFGKKG